MLLSYQSMLQTVTKYKLLRGNAGILSHSKAIVFD